jgi:DNA-binding MarR family transcriptional regulator
MSTRSAAKSSPARSRAQSPGEPADLTRTPEPATVADRVVLEIRRFLSAGIFFNAQAAERAGMGLTDMQMLHQLQLHGPSTPSQLAALTRLSSGGVTVALDRLEKAGYIRRRPNPDDRRSLLIALVPARLRKLAHLYEGVERETRRHLATLSDRDLEAVVRFFEAMRGVAADPGDPATLKSPRG